MIVQDADQDLECSVDGKIVTPYHIAVEMKHENILRMMGKNLGTSSTVEAGRRK